MSGHAIQRLVRQSPRKMRLVVDLIRGKDVNEAYAILQFNKKLAAKQIAKTLKSAVSNAEQAAQRANESFDVDQLVVRQGDRQHGAAAQAVHGRGAGPRHPDPEADQPRGNPRRRRARRRTNGPEDSSDRVPARHHQELASRWYAEQGHARPPQGGRADPQVPEAAPGPRGASPQCDIERKPGKVTVTRAHRPSGRRDRQARRRGGQAARRAGAADRQGSRDQRRGDQAAGAVGRSWSPRTSRTSWSSASRSAAP